MMCSVDCPNPIKDCENSNGSMIVKLESSEPRRFHSHHWFHIAEHYLAHPSSFSSGTKYNASSIYIIPPSSSFYSQLTKSSMFFLLLSLPFENIHRAIVINPSQVIACFPHRDIEKFSTSYTYINIQSYQYLEAYKSVSSLSMTNLIPSCVYFNSITTIESSDKNSIKNNCNNVYLAPGKYAYPSTDWFPNAQDSSLIRQRVMNLCPNLTPYNNESKQFILVIYQRDRSRRFVDLDSILSHIRPLISNQWQIRVINHEDEGDTCELYRTLRDANILLTPHGFQSLSLLFLKPEATLFEVFPFRYFKPTYRDICHQYGLNHQYIQNTAPTSLSRQVLRMVGEAQCMSNKKCRSFARGDDVHMTENHIQVVIDTMKSIEVLHKI